VLWVRPLEQGGPMSRPTTDLILAIANETTDSEALRDAIVRAGAADPANVDVVVVAPALNTRLRHWASDDDRARREAEKRLDRCVRSLHDRGLAAGGWVGDADPLLAIED